MNGLAASQAMKIFFFIIIVFVAISGHHALAQTSLTGGTSLTVMIPSKEHYTGGEIIPITITTVANSTIRVSLVNNYGNIENATVVHADTAGRTATSLGIPSGADAAMWHLFATNGIDYEILQVRVNVHGVSTIDTFPLGLPPLKQFKIGIPADSIHCQNDLQIIIKSSDGTPACVRDEAKQRLVKIGWAKADHLESIPEQQVSISAIQYRYGQMINQPVSDFYVKLEGTGYNYYPPKLWINDSQNRTIWDNSNITYLGGGRPSPGDFCKEYRFYDIGGPVTINDTGTYTMHMSFEGQSASYQLSVKEKPSESNQPTYGKHCETTVSEQVNAYDNFVFTIINNGDSKGPVGTYVQIDDIRIYSELEAGDQHKYGFILTDGNHTISAKSKQSNTFLVQDFAVNGKKQGYLSLDKDGEIHFTISEDKQDLEKRIVYAESSFLNTVDLSANGIPRDSEGRVNYGSLLSIISKNNYVKIFEQNDMPITINDIYLITGPDIAMYHESGYQCGYVNYSNQTFWLESKMNKDTLTELKVLNDNPDKCRPSYDSCFCMAQHHLAENSITKLSYFDESQTSQVAKSIQDYFSDGNKIANVQNLFTVGKYNFDLGTGITPFCGQFKGKSNGWYFHGAIKSGKVIEFSLDLDEKQKLCAIADNTQVYTFDESAIVK